MIKAVILKTDEGIKIFGNIQCSNGSWFNAEGCFRYCNVDVESISEHHSRILKSQSSFIGREKEGTDWYKDRNNFIDVNINIDIPGFICTQEYVQ